MASVSVRRHAFQLPPHRSSMRSQQLAVLDMGALRGVGFARRRIADVERAVAPHNGMDRPRSVGATATLQKRNRERSTP